MKTSNTVMHLGVLVCSCLLPFWSYSQCPLPQWEYCREDNNSQDCQETTQKNWIGGIPCGKPSMILVYEDKFDGNSLSGIWRKGYGAPRGVEYNNGNPIFNVCKQWYAEENVIVGNGTVKLRAEKDPATRLVEFWDPYQQAWVNFTFQAGEIYSFFDFQNDYGSKVTSRVKVFKEYRAREAFWMHGKSLYNPNKWFEADVFEFYADCCIDPDEYFRMQRMTAWQDNEQCHTRWKNSSTMDDWWYYEFEWDRFEQSWRSGTSLSNITTRRVDHRFYSVGGAEEWCGAFENTDIHTTFERDRFIRPDARLGIIYSTMVEMDHYGHGDDILSTPKDMEVDEIQVYQRVPCLGDVVYNSYGDVGGIEKLFNVRLVHDAELNNVVIPQNHALKIIHSGTLTLNPGVVLSSQNSYFATDYNGSPNLCQFEGNPVSETKPENYGDFRKDPFKAYAEFPEPNSLDEKSSGELRIYPNPSGGRIRIDCPGIRAESLDVRDILGRKASIEILTTGNGFMELFLKGGSGIYTLNFHTDEGVLKSLKAVITE